MKNIKQLIQEFNTEETYLMVSDYPEKTKNSEKNYGMAWYTKELIEPISQKYGTKFVVLAEVGEDNTPQLFANGKILVLRVFDQKHPSLFPVILQWMLKFNKIKKVHVQSEFCVNGGVKNVVLLPFFLLLIKATGKDITYFAHNIITDITALAPHFDINRGSLKLKVFNAGLNTLYRMLSGVVDHFVVMDQVIYKRLLKFVPAKKITLAPFWISPDNSKIAPAQARGKLGIKKDEFLLLYFGFVTYYKGADRLIKTVKKIQEKNPGKKIKLIVAGGEAYSLKDKKYYQKFYSGLLSSIKGRKNIKITGFVSEGDIPMYFKACDLAVFPYRGLIGASACLSQAITYNKPFILSEEMGGVLESEDFQKVMAKNGLNIEDITFKQGDRSFVQKIDLIRGTDLLNKETLLLRNKLTQVSADMAYERSKEVLLARVFDKLYLNKEERNWAFSMPKLVTNPLNKAWRILAVS